MFRSLKVGPTDPSADEADGRRTDGRTDGPDGRKLVQMEALPEALANHANLHVKKHPGQVKTSRFLILSQSTGMRGCVILLEDEVISTEKQGELLFWDVLT
uniref:Uncharacterized protein n=1 Tax=Caenorhabditis japonica TaxID=281687 RepID=A0A8R1IIN4_CAEJA